jgi:poly(ADP-ribose) glycohydrolase
MLTMCHSIHKTSVDKSDVQLVVADMDEGGLCDTVNHLNTLVLAGPTLFPHNKIPLLRIGLKGSVQLSADQCACVLGHAFYGILPPRYETIADSMPRFTFEQLFRLRDVGEKWKCLMHYFSRIASRRMSPAAYAWGSRMITFSRLVITESDSFESWQQCALPICPVIASDLGTIEDSGPNHLHVDFANKFVGGGVLAHGCVQEEIRFLICPELIVSMLLCEKMTDVEAVVVHGFERFSNYEGYARTFRFAGQHDEPGPGGSTRMPSDQLQTSIVAIDALNYNMRRLEQYQARYMLRDLNKAFAGYGLHSPVNRALGGCTPLPVCTGNWGAGVFGGCVQLKAVLQILAASRGGRPYVRYLTFGDKELAEQINQLDATIRGLPVSEIVRHLLAFRPLVNNARHNSTNLLKVFSYLKSRAVLAQRL